MINLTREEAQQVLDVLKDINKLSVGVNAIFLPAEIDEVMETLRAKLSEPELVAKMKEMLEVQGGDGNWNYDSYMHGMYNGMEYMLSMVESREPVFRAAPKKWSSKRELVGLTEDDLQSIYENICVSGASFNTIALIIEAKLKEKNVND